MLQAAAAFLAAHRIAIRELKSLALLPGALALNTNIGTSPSPATSLPPHPPSSYFEGALETRDFGKKGWLSKRCMQCKHGDTRCVPACLPGEGMSWGQDRLAVSGDLQQNGM